MWILLQVEDNCLRFDESSVMEQAFNLIFAFDEIISMGFSEDVDMGDVQDCLEMKSLDEERQRRLQVVRN